MAYAAFPLWQAVTWATIASGLLFWGLQWDGYLGAQGYDQVALLTIPLLYMLFMLYYLHVPWPTTPSEWFLVRFRWLGWGMFLAMTIMVHLRYSGVIHTAYTACLMLGVLPAAWLGVVALFHATHDETAGIHKE
jgi:hypothetical protein